MSIINVNVDKCVGCNACVRACPVGDANIARMDEEGRLKILIDDEKCIKCGACIKACSHDARSYADDTQRFLDDLHKGQEIALIAAPAIKVAFDGNWRHALQWLSDHGIKFRCGYLHLGAPALSGEESGEETDITALRGSGELCAET